MITRNQPRRHRTTRRPAKQHWTCCPSCAAVPDSAAAEAQLDDELETVWWSTISATASRVDKTRHCHRCQPHIVHIVACIACGDGPILTGQLAQTVLDANLDTGTEANAETTETAGEAGQDGDPNQVVDPLPRVVVDELTRTGWRRGRTTYETGWLCPKHGAPTSTRHIEGAV